MTHQILIGNLLSAWMVLRILHFMGVFDHLERKRVEYGMIMLIAVIIALQFINWLLLS